MKNLGGRKKEKTSILTVLMFRAFLNGQPYYLHYFLWLLSNYLNFVTFAVYKKFKRMPALLIFLLEIGIVTLRGQSRTRRSDFFSG